jgi:hypothetical protein
MSYIFGKSFIAHVVSSKEECLAELLEYDFVPEGLPVGLGGSWTGGCEPWKKAAASACHAEHADDDAGTGSDDDDDDLTLAIELDLSCLSRNALWMHNQAALASRQEHQWSTASPSLEYHHHAASTDNGRKNKTSDDTVNALNENRTRMSAFSNATNSTTKQLAASKGAVRT